MLSLNILPPKEVAMQLAFRVKSRRLELALTQNGLAIRAGMSLASYRRFERTGEISLSALLRVALAIDSLDEFNQLFSPQKYTSLNDVLNDMKPKRKRGKKNE